jgi:hypothetical protein
MANNGHNPYANLEGDWGWFAKIAEYFVSKVKYEDRGDFRHDLLIEMAKVKAKYELKGKPLTEAGLMRVASYQVTEYWHNLMRHRPVMISLNSERDNGDGDITELWETLADDKAIDLEAWLDAKRWLLGCPRQLVKIAYKRVAGIQLDHKEQGYLKYQSKKELKNYQKVLPF